MYKFNIAIAIVSALLCIGAQGAAVEAPNADLVVEIEKKDDAQTPVDKNSVPQDCHQPKETGRCFALFYRYAYNVDTQECEEFIYGGCAGNNNNFETKELCEDACVYRATESDEETVAATTEPTPKESH